ncbi:MAG TPA: glycosyltransferase family 2 protein [Candidatus Paceibacterota bacterium]|nr:glycosyltransferase family 2 protein [Candidatus Paceibacterota bacterium]
MLATFLIAAFLVVYVYIGYPLVLRIAVQLFSRPVRKGYCEPRVTLIVSAYNEEAVIGKKIENTFALDYPSEKLEIIICSDGSTDSTDEIVRSYDGKVILHRVEGRRGKPECQNQGAAIASGDVLVFSDANSMYDTAALRNLMQNFHDEKVGVVCGELRYKKNNKSDEGLYWKLERFLKEAESVLGSCLGANGAIYAVRKELFHPLPPEACSDFVEPFYAYDAGYRVVYEATAFCTEVPGDNAEEFNRKQRIITNSLQSIYLIKKFLNPFRYGWYSLALWSHKMLRWYAFLFLIVAFIANLFLVGNFFFLTLLLLQVLFYVFAFIGIFSSFKLFSIPYYFIAVNLASFLAVVDTVVGRKVTSWEKVR